MTRCSGGASMWSSPDPAVIHWVSPLRMVPPPPLLSWWTKVPSIRYVDRQHRAGYGARGRVDARQGERVLDGYGRHGGSSSGAA
ncbi:hypothetical protein GCM10010274_13830 [Streptomyces lavendofoliae]|uniref:Uncharacterized protein n=1 Tax=Streptomyces lavendofoliae TaxID=67314 RepID=A0A918HUF3_9ACTN|nr:hypothetical protein GCM10010274_13830 [Streptomyces lavendofoliae]